MRVAFRLLDLLDIFLSREVVDTFSRSSKKATAAAILCFNDMTSFTSILLSFCSLNTMSVKSDGLGVTVETVSLLGLTVLARAGFAIGMRVVSLSVRGLDVVDC